MSPQKRGFANMTAEKRAEISRKGGQASQASGNGHRWTKREAKKMGSKGGKVPR